MNLWICGFPAAILALLMAFPLSVCAKPRPPGPPFPEAARLFHADFDEPFSQGITNLSAFPSYADYVEAWSGYAFKRSGRSVPPFVISALGANGRTNVACAGGSLRFWFMPNWSSATSATRGGPGSEARLAEFVATDGNQAAVNWSLNVNANGSALYLASEGQEGPANLIGLPIAWEAGAWHCIVLNYNENFTELFVDGELVAQGDGIVSVPPSLGGLVIGSTVGGRGTPEGLFDEIATFVQLQSATEVGCYYAGLSGTAALGPIVSNQAERERLAIQQSARALSMLGTYAVEGPPSPGGTNGGGSVTNTIPPPTFNGLCLLPPVFVSSNSVLLTITNATGGSSYDLFAVTNLCLTNWVWLWRSPASNPSFTITPICKLESYYVLGTVQDSDGDGLTDAYERLVSKTDPASFDSWTHDGFGTPDAWYLQHGLNPLTSGMGGQDTDQDGLINCLEYLRGTDPQVSEGFGAWAGIPTCGIP